MSKAMATSAAVFDPSLTIGSMVATLGIDVLGDLFPDEEEPGEKSRREQYADFKRIVLDELKRLKTEVRGSRKLILTLLDVFGKYAFLVGDHRKLEMLGRAIARTAADPERVATNQALLNEIATMPDLDLIVMLGLKGGASDPSRVARNSGEHVAVTLKSFRRLFDAGMIEVADVPTDNRVFWSEKYRDGEPIQHTGSTFNLSSLGNAVLELGA